MADAKIYDYIIVGAGPAGCQMGYYMEKGKQNYVILDSANRPGSFFKTHPKHRFLISINKRFNPFPEHEYNMRHDWNSLLCDDRSLLFRNYSDELFPPADALVRYMNDFASRYDLNIMYNSKVHNIDKGTCPKSGGTLYTVKTENGRVLRGRVMLMATGAREEHLPKIEGLEHCDTYANHDIDPKKYEGKTVAIIGRGNSAFETANHIAGAASFIMFFGQVQLKFAWDTHFVGDLRAINNNILDMYQLKSLHSYTGMDATAVRKNDEGKLLVENVGACVHWSPPGWLKITFPFDHVIVCTGFKYIDQEIFSKNCLPETRKEGKFPVLNNNWEVVNVPDMYYMGTAMQSIDRKAASGFIHGFRYNVRTLYHMLVDKYNSIPYPRTMLERDVDPLGDMIIERTSLSASLYQMNTFLCDVAVVPEEKDGKICYYEDLPLKHVLENEDFMKQKHLFVTVLQYTFDRFGRWGEHATDFIHMPKLEDQECQAFLRPVVYYYSEGKEVDSRSCNESLFLRFNIKNFVEDNEFKNHNIVKNFINKYTNISPGKTYSEHWLKDIRDMPKLYTEFTPEEKERIPKEMGIMTNCKAATLVLDQPPMPKGPITLQGRYL